MLGTSLEIQVSATQEESGPAAEAAALAEIDRLEAIFNAYNPDSELRRWQATRNEDVIVSPELVQVLQGAEHWRQWTYGAFNPAVEALTRLWSKHADANQPVTSQDTAPILSQLEGRLWEIDREHGTARRLTTLPVTLNAIAKGFIIDAASRAAIETPNVEAVLINIGGDIRHLGPKSLTISIADPRGDAENAVPADRIQVQNQGLATSGNYRRGFQIGERWYSHVLDPRSGFPVEHLPGVSVLAPDATTADVLATAFDVLEPKQSITLADSLGNVGVLLIGKDGTRFSNAFWDRHRAAKKPEHNQS